MKCVFCGGRVVPQNVAFVYDDPNNYFVIEGVPAEVCLQCGEKAYAPEVTDEIIRIAKKRLKPVKTIQVPVFNYFESEKVTDGKPD